MKRILFIDDDDIILSTFNSILGSLNYSVTTCNDSRTGLDLALNVDFNLIITDLNMPNFSGIDLIKAIKESKKDSVIYVLTGMTEEESFNQALEAGADGLMEKPFEMSKIVSLMNSSKVSN